MSKRIYLKDLAIGGGAPVSIQAMAKHSIVQESAIVEEISSLINTGAQAIRLAVKRHEDLDALSKILKMFNDVPFIADVHFNYKIAIGAIKAGVHGLRLNPGNITNRKRILEIIKAINDYNPNVVIRVGVNSGSLPDNFSKLPRAEAMVKAADMYIDILEGMGFYNIKVSLKSSDVKETIIANRMFHEIRDYPIHLGVTATGAEDFGVVKSCIGIGALLVDGIGDTIRVSLSSDSVSEVLLGKKILSVLSLRDCVDIVSCPTCGRCSVDLPSIVRQLQELIDKEPELFKGIKNLAVMGCEVNGPGEAKNVDIGVAYGKNYALLFEKGKLIRRVTKEDALQALVEEVALLRKRFIEEG